jgi:hypothetical protein
MFNTKIFSSVHVLPALAALCSVVIVLALASVPARASVARRLALDELSLASDAIVVGRCQSVQSHWNDAHTQIVTEAVYTTLGVEKGQVGRQFSVVALGGVAGDIGMVIIGMPTFSVGREEVLFLSASPTGAWRCVGMSQGQFIVQTTAAGERRVVGRDLNGLELIGDGDTRLAPQSFSAFVRSIRRLVR